MSGLLFLSDEDFFVGKGTKGPILCTNIPGFSLIFFYSNQCPHCKNLDPIFKKLPGTIQGCQFGMLNVNTNRKTINASKNTIAPVTYVPTIILHVNGRPFMRYLGPAEPESLRRFVVEVAQKLQNKQKFSSENVKEEPRGRIPEFTIGHPLYGDPEDMRTYLDFDEAYENKK
jgi:hypothetical protein